MKIIEYLLNTSPTSSSVGNPYSYYVWDLVSNEQISSEITAEIKTLHGPWRKGRLLLRAGDYKFLIKAHDKDHLSDKELDNKDKVVMSFFEGRGWSEEDLLKKKDIPKDIHLDTILNILSNRFLGDLRHIERSLSLLNNLRIKFEREIGR